MYDVGGEVYCQMRDVLCEGTYHMYDVPWDVLYAMCHVRCIVTYFMNQMKFSASCVMREEGG